MCSKQEPIRSKQEPIRIGGKNYTSINNTAKRFDKDKEKPTISSDYSDKQRRKVDNLMARIEKPINIPERVGSHPTRSSVAQLIKIKALFWSTRFCSILAGHTPADLLFFGQVPHTEDIRIRTFRYGFTSLLLVLS